MSHLPIPSSLGELINNHRRLERETSCELNSIRISGTVATVREAQR